MHRARAAWIEQHPDGNSEQFVAYALAQGERLRAAVIWYITRRVSEPYIWQEWHAGHAGRWRRHVLMIDENRKYERPGVTRTRDFLLYLRNSLSGIVTTNYDLLVEYALGTQLFNYGRLNEDLSGRGAYPVSQWRNPVTLRGQIPLAKVHGSISWTEVGKHTDGRGGNHRGRANRRADSRKNTASRTEIRMATGRGYFAAVKKASRFRLCLQSL